MDAFTKAYIETALWSSTDDDDQPLDGNYDISDLAPETLMSMEADCKAFQEANADDIDGRDEQAGQDFFLTRCRHGCGFWETPYWEEEAGKRLTAAAHAFGEVYLYVGDDGKIYS